MKRNRRTEVAIGTAAALAAASAVAGPAQADDLMVTNLSDGAKGSLPAAVNRANSTPRKDRILFRSGLSGLITPPAMSIREPVKIVGPGAGKVTISGGGSRRIFEIEATASISGLTLANGYSKNLPPQPCYIKCGPDPYEPLYGGGAIVTSEDTTISGMRFVNNRTAGARSGGGAIKALSDLTVSKSTFVGNGSEAEGGALSATGPLKITGSEFSGNQAAARGGGLNTTYDDAIVGNSTFIDNQARLGGGGMSMSSKTDTHIYGSTISGNRAGVDQTDKDDPGSAGGGGLNVSTPFLGHLRLENTTITGNRTFGGNGGGVQWSGKDIEVDSVTITGNSAEPGALAEDVTGGGFNLASGAASIVNSVITDNASPARPDLDNRELLAGSPLPDPQLTVAFSLIGSLAGVEMNDEVPGSNLIGADPQLGPLADNGGPTETMRPEASSPVIDQGSSGTDGDQRDFKRPVLDSELPVPDLPGADGSDMGAVELQDGVFTLGKVRLNRKKGVATLKAIVPCEGELIVAGRRVMKQRRKSSSQGTVELTVRARDKATEALRKKGKAKVKVKVKFTPTGGKPRIKSKTVKLVKKKKRK